MEDDLVFMSFILFSFSGTLRLTSLVILFVEERVLPFLSLLFLLLLGCNEVLAKILLKLLFKCLSLSDVHLLSDFMNVFSRFLDSEHSTDAASDPGLFLAEAFLGLLALFSLLLGLLLGQPPYLTCLVQLFPLSKRPKSINHHS